jgi:hypothetical protein
MYLPYTPILWKKWSTTTNQYSARANATASFQGCIWEQPNESFFHSLCFTQLYMTIYIIIRKIILWPYITNWHAETEKGMYIVCITIDNNNQKHY